MKRRTGTKAVLISAFLLAWAAFSAPFASAAIGTATEVDFGDVALGTSETITLVITNMDQANGTKLRFTFSYYECTDFTVDPDWIGFVGPGEAAEVKLEFTPLLLGKCTTDLYVYYDSYDYYDSAFHKTTKSVKILVKGTGVEEDAGGSEPPVVDASPQDVVGNVFIGGCDTGVQDKEINAETGQSISSLINSCENSENTKNHGRFVSCVAHVTNELKKDGVITGREKGAIQRCAGRAPIGKGSKKK